MRGNGVYNGPIKAQLSKFRKASQKIQLPASAAALSENNESYLIQLFFTTLTFEKTILIIVLKQVPTHVIFKFLHIWTDR